MQNTASGAVSVGIVSVSACVGTSSSLAKQPSFTCCCRRFVQRDDLDGRLVAEIRHMRIVERDVPVFADAHAYDVAGMRLKQRGVAAAFRLRVGGGRIDRVDRLERHAVKQPLAQEIAEALRRVGGSPMYSSIWNALIFVKSIDLSAIRCARNSFWLGAAAKIMLISPLAAIAARIAAGRFLCRGPAHFLAGLIDLYV